MLHLYISQKSIKSTNKFIQFVDLEFNKEIYTLQIDKVDLEYIQMIDHATYQDNGMIVTPFGSTWLQNLSTGCKTLILLNHTEDLGNPIINIGECGKNVLDIIMSIDKDLYLYLDYCHIPNIYDVNKKIEVIQPNSSHIMTLREVYNNAWGYKNS